MNVGTVFADTSFWIALVVKQDQYHHEAQKWAALVNGSVITTASVLIETANPLSKPRLRPVCITLIDRLLTRSSTEVVPTADLLWQRGWELYKIRLDKSWSFTDCISIVVMGDFKLRYALTADHHFDQAGFVPLLGKLDSFQ